MNPRVSVVVPLFDKLPFVQRSLDSIAAQTYRDFEVIVVDDGSTDGSGKIAAAYPDPRFRTVRQTNAGPGAARNRGLEEARGELVAFLDADDQWLPRYLETVTGLLDHWGPDVVCVSCCWQEVPDLRNIGRLWKARSVPEGPVRLTPETDPAHAVHLLAFMHPCCTIARKYILRQRGGFFSRDRCLYAEDAFLWMQILLNHTVAFHAGLLVHIDIDASALSHHINGKRPLEPFLAFPEDVEAACPEPFRPLLRKMLAIRAFKTACVWGLAGYQQAARSLRNRFRCAGAQRLPYYWASLVCSTPLGPLAGKLAQSFRR